MENTAVNSLTIDEEGRNKETPTKIETTPPIIAGGCLENADKSPSGGVEPATVVVNEWEDMEMPPKMTARGLKIKEESLGNVAKPVSVTATEEVPPENDETSPKADEWSYSINNEAHGKYKNGTPRR